MCNIVSGSFFVWIRLDYPLVAPKKTGWYWFIMRPLDCAGVRPLYVEVGANETCLRAYTSKQKEHFHYSELDLLYFAGPIKEPLFVEE